MNSERDATPFAVQVVYDQDEVLGARWWQEDVAAITLGASGASELSNVDQSRRTALKLLVVLGGGAVLLGGAFSQCSSSSSKTTRASSLEWQRKFGLAYGATGVAFDWPDAIATDVANGRIDAAKLDKLAEELSPRDRAYVPAYVPTLLQACAAAGTSELTRDLKCIRSPAMLTAFARGEAMRELFAAEPEAHKVALIVDLPGPESVAFAAAVQPKATAVFTFDNWPHPHGVVPAHLTLGALLYHRPQFRAERESKVRPPQFVLDRNRLLPYRNEPDRFDNRYIARLPDAAFLKRQGIERVLYVAPEGAPEVEPDDCNETFVAYRQAALDVRLMGLGDFQLATASLAPGSKPTTEPRPRYYWGGSPLYHGWFWMQHGLLSSGRGLGATAPTQRMFGADYRPSPRDLSRSDLARVGIGEFRSGGASSSGSRGRSRFFGGFGG